MAEWSNAPVLKTGVRESVPWVRIPPPPPLFLNAYKLLILISHDGHRKNLPHTITTHVYHIFRILKLPRRFSRPVHSTTLLPSLLSSWDAKGYAGRLERYKITIG